jgi:hypothetical protein
VDLSFLTINNLFYPNHISRPSYFPIDLILIIIETKNKPFLDVNSYFLKTEYLN